MTARRSAPTAARNFALHGGNTEAWNYRPKAGGEMVVYGGAGTGKTVGNLLKLLDYGDTYPGARMLIIRKTRVSLTESALATWENLILGQGHPVLGNPIQRTSRHQYLWRNTSVLVTGGMDKSDKVLSTEWDMIYCPEYNELNVAEWETLNNRIRAMADEACGWCLLISAGFLNIKPIFIAITFEERVTRCDI